VVPTQDGYRSLKIDADETLPYSTFGNSDTAKVENGFWQLESALTSTVTAGIVSAKARDLGSNGINHLFKPMQL
jgi:S1-C subfamily serine protease